jgi:hypothetical protein
MSVAVLWRPRAVGAANYEGKIIFFNGGQFPFGSTPHQRLRSYSTRPLAVVIHLYLHPTVRREHYCCRENAIATSADPPSRTEEKKKNLKKTFTSDTNVMTSPVT